MFRRIRVQLRPTVEAQASVLARALALKGGDRADMVHHLIQSNRPDCLRTVLTPDKDATAMHEVQGSALFHAAQRGRLECMKVLIKAKSDLNTSRRDDESGDRYEESPVFGAVVRNRPQCLKLLLAAGAAPNLEATWTKGFDRNGNPLSHQSSTPLEVALRRRHIECLRILLRDGGVELRPGCFEEAVMHDDNPAVLRVLMSLNVDLRESVVIAAKNGKTEWLRAMCNANLCTKRYLGDYNHRLLPYAAAQMGRVPCLEVLRQRGVPLDRPVSATCGTPLFAAASWGYHDSVEFLCDHGAEVNRTVVLATGCAAIHVALGESLQTLIKYGADVNLVNPLNGKRAVHYVAEGRNLHDLKLLYEAGADLQAKDNLGRTALDIASERSKFYGLDAEFINFLEDAGVAPEWRARAKKLQQDLLGVGETTAWELMRAHRPRQRRGVKSRRDRFTPPVPPQIW